MSNKGYTLVEAVVYIAVMAILFIIISNSLISIIGTYKEFDTRRDLQSAAIFSFERLTREIREAESVSVAGSFFGTSPGILVLSKIEGGNPVVLEFKLSGTSLHVYKDGADQGPLTASGVSVNSLIFNHSTNDHSELVKMQLTLQSGELIRDFYTSTVLRGAYEG
ncbi:MAG: prepilin-type N-terminal cleavage/methylation domain-containing protein [Candidatus Pacebacteria bacterium]|nr:prepilin-type N-terminal cleavage/methylation domain-containing protein [Candidatus Paceibacterota bacterium]